MIESLPGHKQHLLAALEREHATTMRVLRAYPDGKSDLKPHPKSPPANERSWTFVLSQGLMVKALTTGFDWSKPSGGPPKAPEKVSEISAALEKGHGQVLETLRGFDEAKFSETVQFYVAPKKLGDYTKLDFLWFLLMDHVHHRGQFSIYLRMAEGHVPSIYGPSADEPWR